MLSFDHIHTHRTHVTHALSITRIPVGLPRGGSCSRHVMIEALIRLIARRRCATPDVWVTGLGGSGRSEWDPTEHASLGLGFWDRDTCRLGAHRHY
eukprot:3504557-Prymnesium_polylepis.2